jgi:hypothetical protein
MRLFFQATNLIFTIVLLSLAGCGTDSGNAASQNAAITGIVFAAPVAGASVTVKDNNGTLVAGPVATAADGTYSITVPASALASDLRIESIAGTYEDEATGATATAGALAAFVSGGTLTAGAVHLDPSSTIIHALITEHGKTPAEANAVFSAAFGYTPDTSVAPKNAPPSGSDISESLAGFRAGVFSQMTMDLNLAPEKQFELLAALAKDLADDELLNGSAGTIDGTGLPEDIQNKFECALASYQSNTTCNKTGLTADEIGSLPFSKIALTDSYKVEYVPGMMDAQQGKTSFKLRVSGRTDGSPVAGLSVSLMPMMYMATKNHTTPVDSVVDNNDGTYSCTVYYLMSSAMNGMSMGYWELAVTISGTANEKAVFYPYVGMSMSEDTVRAALKGVSDLISSNSGTATEKRGYYLFNDGLSGTTGNHALSLFIAAKESMMSFPAISTDSSLHDEAGNAWTITAMAVEGSTDNATWISGTDAGGGHWSLSGLAGLASGQTGTVYVRMTINGEQKTTDGNTPSGTNDFATFTVTPSAAM